MRMTPEEKAAIVAAGVRVAREAPDLSPEVAAKVAALLRTGRDRARHGDAA